jgi:hypothetical protein
MSIKKSFGASLQTTDTTLYTVPAGKKAEWVLIYATDTAGSTTSFDVDYYDASETATLAILDGKSLSANDFFKVGGEPNAFIMMAGGDKIIGRCASNDDVTMLISVIESNDIIQGG